ncbi:MAG: hydroxysqualene dehydroxylase HpnE [Chlorobi bacterium]|nr:hydroxysqualene dehydroxylase HpnE [Chlorobiota bacterium]
MLNAKSKKKRCIVVGGGVAGIAAAVDATMLGFDVVLVEGRRYLGGRARSFRDEITGDEIDNGQHVAMGCYNALRYVLRQLGTEQLLRPDEPIPIAFASANGMCDVFDPYRLPGVMGVIAGVLRLQSFSRAERLHLLWGGVRAALGRSEAHETVAALLERYGQPNAAIERFWEPLVLATLNAPSDAADASLLRVVLRRAFFGGGSSHHLLVPRVGLSELWKPLPSWLAERGGEIRLGTYAVELIESGGRIIGVATDDGKEIRGNVVIAAVPSKALQRLLPHHLVTTPEFEMMPIVSAYLWYDRCVSVPPVVGLWGTTSQWLFNRGSFIPRSGESQRDFPGHVEITISGARQLALQPSDDIAALVDEELRAVFPSLAGIRLLRWRVLKERTATVLLTPKTNRMRLGTESGIAGVLVAGDWTATGLPATLESAALSGITAARTAARLLETAPPTHEKSLW